MHYLLMRSSEKSGDRVDLAVAAVVWLFERSPNSGHALVQIYKCKQLGAQHLIYTSSALPKTKKKRKKPMKFKCHFSYIYNVGIPILRTHLHPQSQKYFIQIWLIKTGEKLCDSFFFSRDTAGTRFKIVRYLYMSTIKRMPIFQQANMCVIFVLALMVRV